MSESEVNLLQWSRKNRWKVVGVLEEDGVTGNGGNSSYMESFIKTDVPFEGCEGIMDDDWFYQFINGTNTGGASPGKGHWW